MTTTDQHSNMLKTALTDHHKDMYQWFLFHQECLLLGHERYAQQCLNVYKTLLTAHIDFENTALLAPGSGSDHDQLRWPASVYRQEHDKILALFAAVETLFKHWLTTSEIRKKRLILLTLLEKQLTLRQVIAHHEEREEQDLFECITLQNPSQQPLGGQQHPDWASLQQLLDRYLASKKEIQLFLAAS